jgi:tyrosyl-tRNA synthetase
MFCLATEKVFANHWCETLSKMCIKPLLSPNYKERCWADLNLSNACGNFFQFQFGIESMIKDVLLRSLTDRGLIKDHGNLGHLDRILEGRGRAVVYAGFDPTADGLHVGHLMTLRVLRDFAEAGHLVIPLIGIATAMVGDPTGRTTARPMLSNAQIRENGAGIEKEIHRIMTGMSRNVVVETNDRWFGGMELIEFLRTVGPIVPVSRVLGLEGMRRRLGVENALSVLEFAYPLMQGFDFFKIWEAATDADVVIQIGGSDQWGNICMGLDIIDRLRPENRRTLAFGMTHPLLTKSDGTKMGKSAGNAVWLSRHKLDDFQFFQFWRNLPDADTGTVARMLCRKVSGADFDRCKTVPEIEAFKEAMASELTLLARPDADIEALVASSRNRGKAAQGLRTLDVSPGEVDDVASILVKSGLRQSKSDARRLVLQGGFKVNGVPRGELSLRRDDFVGGVAVLSSGKTSHVALRIQTYDWQDALR